MSKYYSSSIAFGAKQTKTEEVVVSPTKIGNVTTDAVSGALTVDEVPVLNSLNPVSSDGVARAVIQAGAELPTRGSSDTGKVLTVKNSDGDLEWDAPAMPTVDQTYSASSTNPQSGVAVAGAIADKQDTISDLETIRSGAAAGATAVQPSSLATVATTGSYSDLIDKPSIPAAQVNADWNAVSGVSEILNKPNLATVATSGAYSDLSGTPTIPTVDQSYNASSTNAQSGVAVAEAIAAIPAPSVDEVPAVESTDDGKVLTASYSGGQGSYSWQTAQGGGGASYTASEPIVIESDVIKLKYNSTLARDYEGKFTVTSTSADANNTSGGVQERGYFSYGCYGLYVYNTGINLPKAAGSLAILYQKPYGYYEDMKITGAAAAGATGWTVVIYDPKAPTSNYCIANEEYEFAGVSGNDAIVFKTYSSSDTDIYYKFTFSTANCHGKVSGDLLGIQIIPLPTSATSGSSCAGTTYLSMTNSGHQDNYGFAVNGTITPFSSLPAADSGSFSNTYSGKLSVSSDAVKFDPSQFTTTTRTVIPAGAVGDTLGTYGYKGVKVNSAFYTGNPWSSDQTVRYSFKWAETGSWLYDQTAVFTTSQTLASDVRVLFYQISDPTKYCEFTGVTGLGFNWTDYTVGIIGNYWDRYGKCYGPSGSTSTAGYWSIDFTINANTSRGTNTTYMDWQNIVTNTGYAICFYTPGTTGSAPNGCDYSSIPEAVLAKFGNIQDDGLRKVQDKLLVPTSSTADNGKVLTVSSGNATWANPSVVPSDITTAIDAAVDVDTDNAVFTGDGDSVKMEFTRVTDTSSTQVGEVTLTSNTTENANNIVYLIFDLDSGYKTFGNDYSPKVHISDAITDVSNFYGGFSATTTSGSIGSIATVSNQTVAAQDIDVKYKLGNNSYQRRYLLIGAYSITGPAGYDAIAAQLKASVSITGWPGDVYGTKVVIPNIVQVNALPANPDANTLYLIPET